MFTEKAAHCCPSHLSPKGIGRKGWQWPISKTNPLSASCDPDRSLTVLRMSCVKQRPRDSSLDVSLSGDRFGVSSEKSPNNVQGVVSVRCPPVLQHLDFFDNSCLVCPITLRVWLSYKITVIKLENSFTFILMSPLWTIQVSSLHWPKTPIRMSSILAWESRRQAME